MKLEILIKYHAGAIKVTQHGNWIDLYPRHKYHLNAPTPVETGGIRFDSRLIDLGVSMKLPNHFEAIINPRSSTYVKQGVILSNSQGVIDNAFSGEQDIWSFSAIAIRQTTITPAKAICQFRIQPSMDAPWYVKLKWLFSSGVKFKEVYMLYGVNRGGYGTSDE